MLSRLNFPFLLAVQFNFVLFLTLIPFGGRDGADSFLNMASLRSLTSWKKLTIEEHERHWKNFKKLSLFILLIFSPDISITKFIIDEKNVVYSGAHYADNRELEMSFH